LTQKMLKKVIAKRNVEHRLNFSNFIAEKYEKLEFKKKFFDVK